MYKNNRSNYLYTYFNSDSLKKYINEKNIDNIRS
jgi:hypothetical protein